MNNLLKFNQGNGYIWHFHTWNYLYRVLFILFLMIGYYIIFPQMHQKVNDASFAIMMIFPIMSGYLLGMKGGLIAGFVTQLAALSLSIKTGNSFHQSISIGIPVGFIMMFLGGGVGRLRDLTIKVREELNLRKEAEEALKMAKESLEMRIAERTEELVKTNKELRNKIIEHESTEKEKKRLASQLIRAQKMEAIGTLAGGVAHDLNNILSGLVSYPELLLMDLPENSPLRQPILTIKKSGENAAAIVQDMLTLARRGVDTIEVVDLNHIITEYLVSIEHKRAISFYPNVRIETDLENDLLMLSGSPVHLTKTLMNLISNSAEAIDDKGTVTISTENRYVDQPISGYESMDEGDYVILTVSDTGVGISSMDMEKIFEPFYSRKMMGRSGTGLGMAVVWGTVKDHNGYIDVQSMEGEGTSFSLYFPATRKKPAKGVSNLPIKEYMANGESILIVDDVDEQRGIASGMLEKLGYSITSVASGEEAVAYMKDHSADLLVLDMIMDPGIDGLETYKRVLELHPGQKAIIASGFSETDRVKKAQKLGAGAYLKKPYLLEKIGTAIRIELDKD